VAAGIGKSMRDEHSGEAMAKNFLEVINREARQHGVPHESVHVIGSSPSDEIIRAATAKNCDLKPWCKNRCWGCRRGGGTTMEVAR